MEKDIKEQINFVLEDSNELMLTGLDSESDLSEENKQMNRQLIKRHETIIEKVKKGQQLTQHDLQIIRDANRIHVNDEDNLNSRHKQAAELENWLDLMTEIPVKQAFKILEEHLHKDSHTPSIVFRALHTLWEEITPNDIPGKRAFDKTGRCLKCGSKVSFADVTDTVVFASDEIVKRYDGDITNRNCVRCNYPEQYEDYEYHDRE